MFENQPYDYAMLAGILKSYKEDITPEQIRTIQLELTKRHCFLLNNEAKEVIASTLANM